MANPHVDKIQAELSAVWERGYDRTVVALNHARNGTYSADKLVKDAANTFLDGVWAFVVPFVEFLPLSVKLNPPMPIAEFDLTQKEDLTKVIPLIDTTATAVEWEDLTLDAANKIVNTNVVVTLAADALVVELNGTGIPGTPKLGVYVGDIKRKTPTPKVTIGRIRLGYYVP